MRDLGRGYIVAVRAAMGGQGGGRLRGDEY